MDETERLRLDRDLRRSFYQRLLAVCPEPTLTVDIGGRPANWDRSTEVLDGPATGTVENNKMDIEPAVTAMQEASPVGTDGGMQNGHGEVMAILFRDPGNQLVAAYQERRDTPSTDHDTARYEVAEYVTAEADTIEEAASTDKQGECLGA